MRIAIIIESFPSYSETFISNKVSQLALRGHTVCVYCHNKNDHLFNDLFQNNRNVEVFLLNKKRLLFFLILRPFVVFEALQNKKNFRQRMFRKFRIHSINKFSPHIIHFEFSGVAVDYLYELKYLKGRKVVSCRGSAEKVKLLVYEERKRNLKKVFDFADAIHCVSADMQKTILPYCNQPGKIFINYPSIDTEFFKKSTDKSSNKIKMLLSIGRFTFQKGYFIGLLAVRELKRKGINFQWLIVGSGIQSEEIIFHINALQLQDHVEITGTKPRVEIQKLMEHADICFLPSVYEGIANFVLEAMSMEMPVVSTKCGGMQEVITHGKDGLLSNVYDYKSLSENLVLLLDDDQLCRQLGNAARIKVSEKFNINLQINKFEKVYHSLTKLRTNNKPLNGHEEICADNLLIKNEKKILQPQLYQTEIKKNYNPQVQLMHIGIVLPQFPVYSETFFINKVIGLCERGHKITVFCNIKAKNTILEEVYQLKTYANLAIIILDFNRSVFKNISTFILYPFIFFKSLHIHLPTFKKKIYSNLCLLYFNKYRCNIYHFGYSGIAIAYLSILKSLRGKVMVSCRGTAENIKPLSMPDRTEKLGILFAQVDKIHSVSNKMTETIKHFDAEDKKIFLNRPAVDEKLFSRKSKYENKTRIQILSIGRLVFQKGLLLGIMAIAELAKLNSDFKWIIVGEGPEREQLIFHINFFKLNNQILLVEAKSRDEVLELYEKSDILFLPSVSEGIANVALEAMSMKLPVVSSDTGGMGEAITNNVDGILCENYNYKLMAEHLFVLCKDYDKRKKLGERARKTIEERFSTKRYIDVFEQQYLKMIEQ